MKFSKELIKMLHSKTKKPHMCRPTIPALGKLRLEDLKFEVSFNYTVKPVSK